MNTLDKLKEMPHSKLSKGRWYNSNWSCSFGFLYERVVSRGSTPEIAVDRAYEKYMNSPISKEEIQ